MAIFKPALTAVDEDGENKANVKNGVNLVN